MESSWLSVQGDVTKSLSILLGMLAPEEKDSVEEGTRRPQALLLAAAKTVKAFNSEWRSMHCAGPDGLKGRGP